MAKNKKTPKTRKIPAKKAVSPRSGPKKQVRKKPAPSRPVAKRAASKGRVAKKTAAARPAPKRTAAKNHAGIRPAKANNQGAGSPRALAAKPPVKPAETKPKSMEKSNSKSALRNRILARKSGGITVKPIAFTLDEVQAIARTVPSKPAAQKSAAAKTGAVKPPVAAGKPAKPNHVKAASLSDIFGFNPMKKKPADPADAVDVPEKYKRYYKLLIGLRRHLSAGIELHSEETLKRSAKDDVGDLSGYGQHMADAGTDTFDRDFALSLVSSEQEALTEIESAIQRIHAGTYGICEHSGKNIPKERLLAVPFARCSAEAQKEIERNRYRGRSQPGLFGEIGDDAGKMMDDGGGDE